MKKYWLLFGIVLLTAASLVGCGGGTGAAEGDTVTVHYTGTLDDGTVFDSSVGGEPLTFVVGDGSMIVGFDEAVRGMEVGEVKTVTIPPDKAYGEPNASLIIVFSRDELGEGLQVGDKIQMVNTDTGEVREFTVIEVTDTELTLDGNSELVGQDVTFEIEMVAIEKAVSEESTVE
jgi:peptidylprolyl isomerase